MTSQASVSGASEKSSFPNGLLEVVLVSRCSARELPRSSILESLITRILLAEYFFRGYWLVGAGGGVFTFGDAGFYGP